RPAHRRCAFGRGLSRSHPPEPALGLDEPWTRARSCAGSSSRRLFAWAYSGRSLDNDVVKVLSSGIVRTWASSLRIDHAPRRCTEMTIVRRGSPLGELVSLRQAMDRLFEDSVVKPRTWGVTGEQALPLDVTSTSDEL